MLLKSVEVNKQCFSKVLLVKFNWSQFELGLLELHFVSQSISQSDPYDTLKLKEKKLNFPKCHH